MKNTLNYQGNKKSLLPFISLHMNPLLISDKYLLDIFSGSGSVSIYYGQKTSVAYNDLEPYSINLISSKLLFTEKKDKASFTSCLPAFTSLYEANKNFLSEYLRSFLELENDFLRSKNIASFKRLQDTYPTIWNGLFSPILNSSVSTQSLKNLTPPFYALFSFYYANTYFSIRQCIEIDSLRYAIERIDSIYKPIFFSALYHAMDECVFSKDGHMAQPLNVEKFFGRALKKKSLSIQTIFFNFIKSFEFGDYAERKHKGYNLDFADLIETDFFKHNVGCVYADPPYTDMQYSRYYHLLTTATQYGYPEPTRTKHGYTKGLYLQNRSQSKLSCRNSCLNMMRLLMRQCRLYKINLVISFGYPVHEESSKTDRYVMSIHDLISSAKKIFGESMVRVVSENYLHANNRNSKKKEVLEYLVLCEVTR